MHLARFSRYKFTTESRPVASLQYGSWLSYYADAASSRRCLNFRPFCLSRFKLKNHLQINDSSFYSRTSDCALCIESHIALALPQSPLVTSGNPVWFPLSEFLLTEGRVTSKCDMLKPLLNPILFSLISLYLVML